MQYYKLITIGLVCLLLSACGGASGTPPTTDPPTDNNPPPAYVVTGIVRDAREQPVEGAEVILSSAYSSVGSIRTYTGADGRYRVNAPEGSWIATAGRWVNYHGLDYCLDTKPSSLEAVWAADGGVRDFTVMIQGEDERTRERFGGWLELEAVNVTPSKAEPIMVTLTPDGPLLDGSTGQTLEFVYDTEGLLTLKDVPLGRYRIQATQRLASGALLQFGANNVDTNSVAYQTEYTQFDHMMGGCDHKYSSQVILFPSEAPPIEPGPGTPGEPGSISGTLTAPAGRSVLNTLVYACPSAGGCEAGGNGLYIEGDGGSATFSILDLTTEPHEVFAWQDTNGNEEMDEGDLLGMYTQDGENSASVTPPASGIEIVLATP